METIEATWPTFFTLPMSAGELFALAGVTGVAGVATAQERDTALVTAHGSGFYLYNVNERKCVRSWSVKPTVKFSDVSPSVLHAASKQFLAVDAQGQLLSWPLNSADLNEAEAKHKFDKKLAAVVSAPSWPHAVVVSADGFVAPMAGDGSALLDAWQWPLVDVPKAQKVKLLAVDAASPDAMTLITSVQDQIILTVLVWNETTLVPASSTDILAILPAPKNVKKKQNAPSSASLPSQHQSKKTTSNSADEEESTLVHTIVDTSVDLRTSTIAVLWSTGYLQIWQLDSEDHVISLQLSLPLKGLDGFGPITKDVPAAVALLNSNCAVIVGFKEGRDFAMAWELKYGTLQFETELSTLGLTSSPLAPTDKRVVRATSIPTLAGHNVFITTPIGIRVLPVIVDERGPSLLAALGKLNASAPYLARDTSKTSLEAPLHAIVKGENLLGSQTMDEWSGKIKKANSEEAAVLKNLLESRKKAVDQQAFSQIFFKYVHSGQKSVAQTSIAVRYSTDESDEDTEGEDEDEDGSDDPDKMDTGSNSNNQQKRTPSKKSSSTASPSSNVKKDSKRKSVPTQLSPSFIQSVCEQCLAEKRFFADDVLAFLISSKLLSATAHPTLISSLIERKQLKLLSLTLLHVYDIPELTLVDILRFALLEEDDEVFSRFLKQEQVHTTVPLLFKGDEPRCVLLYLLLSAPRNDVFMWPCLKTLSMSEVQSLLSFLLNMIVRFHNVADAKLRHLVGTRVPSFRQVVDWIGLLMDVHFTQVILTPETHGLLETLRWAVSDHINLCDSIEGIKGYLRMFRQRNAIITAPEIGEYQIEVLHV